MINIKQFGILLLTSFIILSVGAQSPPPTKDQLRLLQQLPADERQAVLDAYVDSSEAITNTPIAFPELVVELEELDPETEEYEAEELKLLGQFFEQYQLDPTKVDPTILDPSKGVYDQEIALKPFGYNLFSGVPTTFAPATDIPVPPEYKIGPGDTIEVQLFGRENRQYSLVVTRDGTINFPDIGPINVIGLDFQELKQDLLDRVAERLSGTGAAISMGSLRSIRVFILGDANRPGSYTVSGLSTITNALFLSGGIDQIGSLRNIQLKRNGKLIETLDLYDLLISGNTKNDARLQSGDVIFIPPIGSTIGVGGYVKRPAIYELKNEKTANDAIELAGGFRADAYPGMSRIERITSSWERAYLNLDLSTKAGKNTPLIGGDVLLVPAVLTRYKGGVQLSGHVLRPGDFEWHDGLRLADIITSLDELRPQADINYVLIRRETWPDKRVKALSANLQVALENPESDENILLQPRDVIRIFNLDAERAGTDADILQSTDIQLLANELKLQATAENPLEIVTITGKVRAPGSYPFEEGMRLDDLIRAGANLAEGAYVSAAELARFEVVNEITRRTKVINVNPAAALAGNPEANILLKPYDSLQIREIQEWRGQLSVLLEGEVRFPGSYSFNPGDTLSSIIERAGGLTNQAFAAGSIFLREDLREREEKQIEDLTRKIESDLATLTITAANEANADAVEAESAGRVLLEKLANTAATGRLVINLPAMLANPDAPESMVLLKQGDHLMIPEITQSVTVLGEVHFPTSHLYNAGLNRNAYIDRSGGITQNAEKKQIYIVRANGAVLAGNQSSWFSSGRRTQIEPGDTIVVPLDTRRVSKLRLWADVTQVIFNMALAAAAVNSF